MIMNVLVNWGVLETLYVQNDENFLLEDNDTELVQLFSLLFRVLVFLRMSQATHMCSDVHIVLEL